MQRRTSRAGTPILRTRAVFPSLLCAIALLAGGFLPTHAAPTPQLVPVATGLDNPRHMHFGPDGALYVAEAGRGGGPNAPSFVGSDGSTQYYGPTGAVTEITPYGSARIVTGLPSAAAIDGGSATGPTDLSAGDGLYVLMGGLTPSTRATLAATEPLAQDFDDLLLILSPDNDRYWIPSRTVPRSNRPTTPTDWSSTAIPTAYSSWADAMRTRSGPTSSCPTPGPTT